MICRNYKAFRRWFAKQIVDLVMGAEIEIKNEAMFMTDIACVAGFVGFVFGFIFTVLITVITINILPL